MIRQENIEKFKPIVKSAIEELFKYAWKQEDNPGDFLLFLNNGHYEETQSYVIGQGFKGMQDHGRVKFFEQYANFPLEIEYNKIEDENSKLLFERDTIHLEMMMYCHFWESNPNLVKLKQLANLVDSKPYNWNIEIPDFSRHKFIRNEIKGVFGKHNLVIADVISRSYHSQLRNAFAHSDYYFFSDKIGLNNYSGKAWELKEISIKEWDERFLQTALIFDILLGLKEEGKKVIGKSDNYGVWIPIRRGLRRVYLNYDPRTNIYRFPFKG